MTTQDTHQNKQSLKQGKGVLLVQCVDQVSVIELLNKFFSDRGLVVLRFEKVTCDGQAFSRIEWSLDGLWDDQSVFSAEFAPLGEQLQAHFSVRFMSEPHSIGLFASKQADTLVDVISKHQSSFFPYMGISFIIGNDHSMEKIADRYGVPFFLIDTDGDALTYEKRQLEIIQRYKPTYLGLTHYVNTLSTHFLKQLECPVISVHRAYLSASTVIESSQMAFEQGVKTIGATARFVTPELNQGPIIEQNVVRVNSASSIEEINDLGNDVEKQVFADALMKLYQHKVCIYKNRTIVFN